MKKNNSGVIKYVFLGLVFFVSIGIGVWVWDKIILPFHNPWGVVGPITGIGYNPANNIIRFSVLLFLPVLLLFALYLLGKRKFNNIIFDKNLFFGNSGNIAANFPSKNRILFFLVLMVFAMLFAVNLPTFHSSGDFDPFHEGESLGTSISYMDGKIPYKDFIFCHGLYQDPLRSVVAFKLFGQSIGSVRTLESIVKILSIILLAIILLKLFSGNYLFALASMIILVYLHLQFETVIPALPNKFIRIVPREITTFLFLITILYIKDIINGKNVTSSKFFCTAFFFSFIPFASVIYSIDKGFYLIATYVLISPLLYFFFFRKTVYQKRYLIFSVAGIITALLLLLLLLRGNFAGFYNYALLTLPKYKELLDGFAYPIADIKFLLIIVLIAANTYWVAFKFIQELYLHNKHTGKSVKSFGEKYLIEFSFSLLSVFFFRSALGRVDWEHVAYTSWITYLLSVYILFKHYLYKYSFNKSLTYLVVIIAVISSCAFAYRMHKNRLLTDNFPVHIADSKFIPVNYKTTIEFLNNNLNKQESFYTMTSEASWYYFVKRPCPTRFPVVWFAATNFYQQEIINDLKNKNVKFILYKNDFPSSAMDGFEHEVRFPLISDYIKQNYNFFKNIDNNEIWINKLYQ